MPFDIVGEHLAHAVNDLFGASHHDDHLTETGFSFGEAWAPIGPVVPPRILRHFLTAFEEGKDDAAAGPAETDASKEEGKIEGKVVAQAADAEAAAQGSAPKSGAPMMKWENEKGFSMASIAKKSEEFFSRDIADNAAEETPGKFNPNFGCKCGQWGPALSHPSIEFLKPFAQVHPDFAAKFHKLKVHMEDDTKKPPVLHWDAVYDLRRFMSPEDKSVPMLKATDPAVVDSGEQTRFKTFCPPEGEEHKYTLKVTALDANDQEIPYAKELKLQLTAKANAFTPSTTIPPAPDQATKPGNEGEADDKPDKGPNEGKEPGSEPPDHAEEA